MKEPLQKIVASRYGGRGIPVALVLPDGGRVSLSERPEVDIYARTWNGLRALASPELGKLARAYVHNDIDFSGGARRVLGVAESLVGSVTHGRDHLRVRARHWWNTARGNKANIQHHYDVSNAFYRMWLDERLVYSCAYFKTDADTLDQAQAQKLDHICRKLQLRSGDEFLDIGCGWGGLILWAAQNYGVKATGITLSENQFDHVKARVAELGLGDRVRVELLDYINLPEDRPYDKIASIGMFEHVGIANYPRYFGKIYRLLKPGGMVLNHGITQNEVGAESLGSGIGDFVEEYVFPGGQLTHVSRVVHGLAARGPGIGRCRGPARALRANALALARPAGSRIPMLPGAKSVKKNSASGESISRVRRTLSSGAGCRFFSCSPASPCLTVDCRIRRRATTCIASGPAADFKPASRPSTCASGISTPCSGDGHRDRIAAGIPLLVSSQDRRTHSRRVRAVDTRSRLCAMRPISTAHRWKCAPRARGTTCP